jgi:hypothetical protein
VRQREGLGLLSGLHNRKIGNEWINTNERVKKYLEGEVYSSNKMGVGTS